MMVNLMRGIAAAEIPLDLVLAQAAGPLLTELPKNIRVIDLAVGSVRKAIPPLVRYLRRERPVGIVSRMIHANIAMLIARKLARVKSRVVVVEANTLSALMKSEEARWYLKVLSRWLYPAADEIVGVSAGVARDLETCLGLQSGYVRVIYNPVVDESLLPRARAAGADPWFTRCDVPVLLTVGRLVPQKDHATLLRALAMVRLERPVRLVILGEGEERGRLEALRRELGLEADVDMPGFSVNPYASMYRADLFVLSSRFEGLPNALIEAMACGCPVVSTNCPSGPEEILDHGKYGRLVPIKDPRTMADAILAALAEQHDRQRLQQLGARFSLSAALVQYLDALRYPLPNHLTVAA